MKLIEKLLYRRYLGEELALDNLSVPLIKSSQDLFDLDQELFLFDGFGTLYLRDRAMPGAVELWNGLRKNGKRLAILTNSASRSHLHICESARSFGFEIDESDVCSSGEYFLATSCPAELGRIFHIGNNHAEQFLRNQGYVLSADLTSIESIVVSSPVFDKQHRELLLAQAKWILSQKSMTIHILNPDACAPHENGSKYEVSGAHAWRLDPTMKFPFKAYGKPMQAFFKFALQKYGVSTQNTVMIGDTLGTDIAGARRTGIQSYLCMQGNSQFTEITSDIKSLGLKPDFFLSIL